MTFSARLSPSQSRSTVLETVTIMPTIEFKELVTFEIEKGKITAKALSTDFNYSKFSENVEVAKLVEVEIIQKACNQPGSTQKGVKKEAALVAALQAMAKNYAPPPPKEAAKESSKFDKTEAAEAKEAEAARSKAETAESAKTIDTDPNKAGIQTSAGGKIETDATIGEGGELIPVALEETLLVNCEFGKQEVWKEESQAPIKGKLTITNPSKMGAKLTNVNLWLENYSNTDIKDKATKPVEENGQLKLHAAAIDPTPEKAYKVDYAVKSEAEKKLAISVEEKISTQGNEQISFSLSMGSENPVKSEIIVKNLTEETLENVSIHKEIIAGFNEPTWENPELGTVEKVGEKIAFEKLSKDTIEAEESGAAKDSTGQLLWKIEKLEKGKEVKLIVKAPISLTDPKESKLSLRSGRIKVEYKANTMVSGMKIGKFEAMGRNKIWLKANQSEEKYTEYSCMAMFENLTDFRYRLTNFDIVDKESKDKKKYIDIDPANGIYIYGKAKWVSDPFIITTANSKGPQTKQYVDFFAVRSDKDDLVSKGIIQIQDKTLAVAKLDGTISYSVTSLLTRKDSEFNVEINCSNAGAAEFNEIAFVEKYPDHLVPDLASVIVSINGSQIELPAEARTMDPPVPEKAEDLTTEDKTTKPHTITVALKGLKKPEKDLSIKKGDKIKVQYKVNAYDVPQKFEHKCDVEFIANTDPKGIDTRFKPEVLPKIDTKHIRRNILKSKEVEPVPDKNGTFKVTISYKNDSDKYELEEVDMMDLVPKDLTYEGMSMEPTAKDEEEGNHLLKWHFDKFAKSEEKSVTYILINVPEEYDTKALQNAV